MSLTKKVYLTISGYDIKLSDNLTFYQKDQLKLIFYINEYGIDYENNATTRALMPVNPLNAILFIENPDGVDSVSSAKIEDNAVTFYLDSTHTQYVGVSRMQLRLFDQDGCAITLPHFTFEIRENIYGSGDVRFQNVVMVDQTGTVILTEDNDLLDVGDILTMGTEVAYPQVTKTIKELPIKHGLDGTEKLIVEDNEATKQAPLGTIVDEIKQNSQEKIREIESDLAQTNAQLSDINDRRLANGKFSVVNTIEELKSKSFEIGDVIHVLGYYNSNDGATHERIISNVSNGVSELLNNGLYANLVYTDEINLSWIGARNSDEFGQVYDIKPYIEKVVALNPMPKMRLGFGFWGISENNFWNWGFQLCGATTQPIYEYNKFHHKSATTLFPIDVNQTATLSLGETAREMRGVLLEGLEIQTNNYGYVDGNFKMLDTGSNIGLDLITVSFSKIRDLTICGWNDAQRGLQFNGCECYFRDIMFRGFGVAGGKSDYAFYTYNRDVGGYPVSPSGLRYENISFEGVACPWFRMSGVDCHLDGVNGEINYIEFANGYNQVKPSDLPNGNYASLGLICVDQDSYSVKIDNISVQNLGYSYSNGTKFYSFDTIVMVETQWGAMTHFAIDGVICQNTLKDIYAINYNRSNSGVDSNGDYSNKPVYQATNIVTDNYRVLYNVKDNAGVITETSRYVPKTNGLCVVDRGFVELNNSTLLPKHSLLQHCVMFDSLYQTDYMGSIKTKYPEYQFHFGIFDIRETLNAGNHTFSVTHSNHNGTVRLNIILEFEDGTKETLVKTLPLTAENQLKVADLDLSLTTEKKVYRIRLLNEWNTQGVKIFKVVHKYNKETEYFDKISMKKVTLDYIEQNLSDVITDSEAGERYFQCGIIESNKNENPINTHSHYMSFDLGNAVAGKAGFQFVLPGLDQNGFYIRNGSSGNLNSMGGWVYIVGTPVFYDLKLGNNEEIFATYSDYKILDTPLNVEKMRKADVYEDYVAYMTELENSMTDEDTMTLTALEIPQPSNKLKEFKDLLKLI